MSFLRRLSSFARLVLAAWLLTQVAAIASPAVQPPAFQMVCSGGTMKWVALGEGQAAVSPGLDCPLCVTLGAPPPAEVSGGRITAAPAGDPLPAPAWPGERRTAERPPVRGPPAAAFFG